jgi:hypothetical protein
MGEEKLRSYTVHVRETRIFWDTVEVQASSEEQACELALEEFQVDWSDSEEVDITTSIIAGRKP